jgi:exonuclease SbcC
LEISGFGAFRDPTIVDFADADFFALVGPTGSGKSTVIDAVCFALYGSVPRYENKGLIRYVVTLGSSEAKVSLTFDLEGATYIATRVVRRQPSGGVTTKEARLERLQSAGPSEVLAGREGEMGDAVKSLLRLDFDDFTRCVVLPQGQFATFLRAKGEDRRALLIKLLNLDVYLQIGSRAGRRAETAKAEATLRHQSLDSLAYATEDALKLSKKRVGAIEKLTKKAEKARPKIDTAIRLAEEQTRLEKEALGLVAKLAKVAVPDEARKHGTAVRDAKSHLAAAEEASNGARDSRQRAEQETKDIPDLAELQGAIDAHSALTTCTANLNAAREAATQASAAEATANQVLADTQAAHDEVAAALKKAEAAHLAENLAQSLVVGQPCPVCQVIVEAKPALHAPKALAAAKKAEKDSKEAVEKARTSLNDAVRQASEFSGRVKALEVEREGLEAKVKKHPDAEALAATFAMATAKVDVLSAARKAEDVADAAVKESGVALEKLTAKGTTLQSKFGSQRDSVVALGPPPPGNADLLADWEALAQWATEETPRQKAAAQAAAATAALHREDAASQTEVLIDECALLDVAVHGDLVAVLTALAHAHATATGEIEKISTGMTQAKALAEQIKELDEQAQVASTLRNLLRANQFPEWLIEEALQLLVLEASETLRKLTNDEFSLALGEQEFMVIDHANADERRSARTLSGGETFQASLALALALSDQIRNLAAEGAPMLDALFLDEGFGTLDSETLETVAATIENLGQSGRMVGIITHVRELAARVPVRFEVQKGPRTSIVERRAS